MNTRRHYDPQLILKHQKGILPVDEYQNIPASTIRNWKNRSLNRIHGFDKRCAPLTIDYLKKEHNYQKLRKAGTALYFINKAIIEAVKDRPEVYDNYKLRQQLISIIDQYSVEIPKKKLMNWSGIKPQQFYAWRRRTCKASLMEICRLRHPSQLTFYEVKTIESYLKSLLPELRTKSAVYGKMIRDGKAFMALKTFYNYSRLLGYKTNRLKKKRRSKGISADHPKQILHMDVTQYKFADHTKAYIYLIQDNFSRKILNWKISRVCNSTIAKENLQEACEEYDLMKEKHIDLIVDGGIENKGEVMTYLKAQSTIKLKIAMKDIKQSNSMIEAANRCIKHYHLFPLGVSTYNELRILLPKIIYEYNFERYKHNLNFKSPDEAFYGVDIGIDHINKQFDKARKTRHLTNSQFSCNKHCT